MALLDNPDRKCDLCDWRTLSGFCSLTTCARPFDSSSTSNSIFIRTPVTVPVTLSNVVPSVREPE